MEYRRLGRSGLKISALVLGTLNFGRPTPREEAFRIIDRAIDSGVNLFDCSNNYAEGESERVLGDALARDAKRHSVFITSKVFMPSGPGPNDRGNSKHHILESCERSLKQLKTDHIDIYFLHRTDFDLPQEEPLEALGLLVRQGKIRYTGCSTHPAWRTVEALWLADKHRYPKFVCEQPPYNLLDRRIENEILPMCQAYDLGILSWGPLAQGVLAGRYEHPAHLPEGSRGSMKPAYGERITERGIEVARALSKRASEKGWSTAQFAVAWVLSQPGITGAILGPRTLQQFETLLPAAEITLDESDQQFCDALIPPGTHVSHHFNTSLWMKG